jgi:hypothetical protein
MSPDSKRPVTLEDLLRLKRAEHPEPEFWEQFDRQLRSKQLAALVEKRPWWRDLPRVVAGAARFSRYHIPLGATAVLAVTYFSVRDFEPVSRGPEQAPAFATAPVEETVLRSAPIAARETPGARNNEDSFATAEPVAYEAVAPATLAPRVPATRSEPPATPGELSRMVSMIGSGSSRSTPVTPSALHIAENLAVAQAVEPGIARTLLGTTQGFESRAMPARTTTVDPLQQMTPPSERRIARLQAIAVSAGEETPARIGERYGSRLSDEKLYERGPRRIGGAGDRFSLKL